MKYLTKNKIIYLLILGFTISVFACTKILPKAPKEDEVMNGTVPDLTFEQKRIFLDGTAEFDEIYTPATGLGPIFVASSCAGCHAGNNRGHPFTNLVRFGQSDTFGNQYLHMGAPQIQQNAIQGHTGEQVPSGVKSSVFMAPIVSGNGYLELVSDQDLINMSDPNDANGEGISGRPNWHKIPEWVIPASNAVAINGNYIGRFGRKASSYNLHHQTVAAFNNDMGITTTFMPENPYNHQAGTQPIPIKDPELTDQSINATVFYLQALQAPQQRTPNDVTVMLGQKIFSQINCSGCHKETLKTGYSAISALSNTNFHPYTDLLLHDMGPDLNDGYTEGSALTSEWRTTPLWGLGLATASQGGKFFLMHDGRAKSIEEAIQLHGGEALKSRNLYQQLPDSEKEALIKFLKSL